MTAQIPDKFRHGETTYEVAGFSHGEPFSPQSLGLEPQSLSTACWRGYQVVYSTVDGWLVVADLRINLFEPVARNGIYPPQRGPAINGVEPTDDGFERTAFNNCYQDVNLPLDYSGGLLTAKGFIADLYVHMGFHPAWKYKSVLELVFENGELTDEFDRSQVMAELREMLVTRERADPRQAPTLDEMKRFVEQAFNRSYGL